MLETTRKKAFCPTLRVVTLSIGMVCLGNSLSGCAQSFMHKPEGEKKVSSRRIEDVLKEYTDEWMAIPGVVGTAIGEFKGKPCIKVLIRKKTNELTKRIPARVEGFVVVIQETGKIRALDIEPK